MRDRPFDPTLSRQLDAAQAELDACPVGLCRTPQTWQAFWQSLARQRTAERRRAVEALIWGSPEQRRAA